MKKIFQLLLILLISFSAYAQDEEILGVWYLDYIIENGIQYESSIPDNNYYIEFTNQSGNEFGLSFSGSACYSYSASYSIDASQNEITIGPLYTLAEGCSIEEEEEDYFFQYSSILNNDVDSPTINTYSVSGLGNNASLIITTENGNLASYNRADLSPTELLGEWFLYSVNVNGQEQSFEGMYYDYNLIITEDDFNGLLCNSYWSKYYLDYNNKITLLGIGQTLGGCESSGGASEDYESNLINEVLINDGNYYPSTHDYVISGTDDNASLIITDIEGDFAIYGRQTLSINSFSLLNVSMFPNPTSGILTIKGLSNFENIDYSIIDLNGRVIEKNELQSEDISVSNLQSGVYFLQLEDFQNAKSKILKFIKL